MYGYISCLKFVRKNNASQWHLSEKKTLAHILKMMMTRMTAYHPQETVVRMVQIFQFLEIGLFFERIGRCLKIFSFLFPWVRKRTKKVMLVW